VTRVTALVVLLALTVVPVLPGSAMADTFVLVRGGPQHATLPALLPPVDRVRCLTPTDKTAIRTTMSQWAVASAQEAYLKWRGQPSDPNVALRADLYTPAARAMWEPEAARLYRAYLAVVGSAYVVARGPGCERAVVAFWRGNGVTVTDVVAAVRLIQAEMELGTGTDLENGGYGADYNVNACGSCAEIVDSGGGEFDVSAAFNALNVVFGSAAVASALTAVGALQNGQPVSTATQVMGYLSAAGLILTQLLEQAVNDGGGTPVGGNGDGGATGGGGRN